MTRIFTAYIEFDSESQMYYGVVPGIRGAHSIGATLDELHTNLKEALALCLEEYGGDLDDIPRIVGLQQIEIET